MNKHVFGSDQLAGFDDLLLKDKLKVARSMGWPTSGSVASVGQIHAERTSITKYGQRSGWGSAEDALPNSGWSSGRQIGAQAAESDTDDVGGFSPSDPPSSSSVSQTPRFEPIISFPAGPLPSLDFRSTNRAPHSVSIIDSNKDLSNKISSYKEDPTSIIGQKFLFKDGNRTWEASAILFDKKGWGPVTVEGKEEKHVFDLEVLLSMLKHGVLDQL
ncbi:hypothetical protein JR316_0009825 [Psilocybe cubensis]|uniref:Uncharacterized protein n=2 Tax=Psilocybe cubensis TaxID=181762 RepID=A0A8H8CFD8_PSICU|nr:hypothetical protein JR316_0009825 [Psilocybe cubensis]KAH9477603.1 hypothetical protein JR316_0009825 [Psilocybe cubensis]